MIVLDVFLTFFLIFIREKSIFALKILKRGILSPITEDIFVPFQIVHEHF